MNTSLDSTEANPVPSSRGSRTCVVVEKKWPGKQFFRRTCEISRFRKTHTFHDSDTHVVYALARGAGLVSLRPGNGHDCRDGDRSDGRRGPERKAHHYGPRKRLRPHDN